MILLNNNPNDNKCCLICHRDHHQQLFRDDDEEGGGGSRSYLSCLLDNKKDQIDVADTTSTSIGHVVLASGYIYCHGDCSGGRKPPDRSGLFTTDRPSITQWTCRTSKRMDPGYEAFADLPYMHDLLIDHSSNPTHEKLLILLYQEWSLREMMETSKSMQQKYDNELKSWKTDKDKEFTKKKKELEDAAAAKAAAAASTTPGKKKKKGPTVDGKQLKELKDAIDAQFQFRRNLIEADYQKSNRTHLCGAANSMIGDSDTTVLDQLKSSLNETTELVTKAIEKHFRRASIKVHPDRNGPQFQTKFDDLTKAKDTLMDEKLREKYVDSLMPILSTFGTSGRALPSSESPMLLSSHFEWVKKNQPDLVEQPQMPQQQDRTFRIEGGLLYSKPRRPHVRVLDDKKRHVQVILRVPQGVAYEFHERWQKIYIHQIQMDHHDKVEPIVETFTRSILEDRDDDQIKLNDIEVDLTIPKDGIWDLWWSFEAAPVMDGNTTQSEMSETATIDIRPYFHARLADVKSFERIAARHTNHLKSHLSKFSSSSIRQQTTSEIESFQGSLLRAKQTRYNLRKGMKAVGVSTSRKSDGFSSTIYGRLVTVIDEAAFWLEDVVAALHSRQNHESKKHFKQSVYQILELGDGGAWMEALTNDELQQKGGDANRLYQLLMEGKKAFRVDLVDASVLSNAANRADLFSPKQIGSLTTRAEQTEQQAAEDARKVAEEETKKEEEEKARKVIEQHAAAQFQRGELVQIQGLKKQPQLNGRFVSVMGIHFGPDGQPTDRVEVRMFEEDRRLALLNKNLAKADKFVQPTLEVWDCKHCTYVHEKDEAKLDTCAMCGSPRDAKEPVVQEPSVSNQPSKQQKQVPTPKSNASSKGKKQKQQNQKTQQPHKQQNHAAGKQQNHSSSNSQSSSNSSTKQQRRQKQPLRNQNSTRNQDHFSSSNSQVSSDSSSKQQKRKKQPHHNKIEAANQSNPNSPSRTVGEGRRNQNLAPARPGKSKQQSNKISETVPSSVNRNKAVKSTPSSSVTETLSSSPASSYVQSLPLSHETPGSNFVAGSVDSPGQIENPMLQKDTHVTGMPPTTMNHLTPKFDDFHSVAHTAISGDVIFAPTAQVPMNPIGLSFPSINENHQHLMEQQHQPQLFSSPSAAAPQTYQPSGRKSDILLFLESHEKALKCKPSEFAEWLKSEDIVTMEDLADACNDEDFVSELVNNGLKKFKLTAFRKSAASHQ